MSVDLNLLPNVAKFQLEKIRLKKRVNQIVIVAAVVWAVAGVLVAAGWMLAKWNLENQTALNKKALGGLQTLAGNAAINQSLRYKAKLVGDILAKRFEYYAAFRALESLFSGDVTIENYKMEQQNGFAVEARAAGGAGMDEVEKKVAAVNRGEVDRFSGAKILSLEKRGNMWNFKMEVVLK